MDGLAQKPYESNMTREHFEGALFDAYSTRVPKRGRKEPI